MREREIERRRERKGERERVRKTILLHDDGVIYLHVLVSAMVRVEPYRPTVAVYMFYLSRDGL